MIPRPPEEDLVMKRSIRLMMNLAAPSIFTIGCGSDRPTGPPYDPHVDPADFVARVDNPLFPLAPGTVYYYRAQTDEGEETDSVEVLSDTRTILGITATIVHDRVFRAGELIEETFDWYAQDKEGTVWYLGEDSRSYEHGHMVSTEGSWEAGVDGAKPGIIMWGNPGAHIGEDYRQEYYRGSAEDWGRVAAVNESASVPFGSFTGCAKTEEWSALEPDVLENKYYCPGIGLVLETTVRGGSERNELVDVR
jgi:hypothetical protein